MLTNHADFLDSAEKRNGGRIVDIYRVGMWALLALPRMSKSSWCFRSRVILTMMKATTLR